MEKIIVTVLALFCGATSVLAQSLTPEEARAIAKEAYIYGFPLVDSYRVQHSYFVDHSDPEFKATWNRRGFLRLWIVGSVAWILISLSIAVAVDHIRSGVDVVCFKPSDKSVLGYHFDGLGCRK